MKVRSNPQPNPGQAQDRIWCIHAWRRCSVTHPDYGRVALVRCMHCLKMMGRTDEGRSIVGMPIAFGETWTPHGADRGQSHWLAADDRSPIYQWPTNTVQLSSRTPTFSRTTSVIDRSTGRIIP